MKKSDSIMDAQNSEWEESGHPRDEDGKFTSTGGSGTPTEIKRLTEVLGKVSDKKSKIEVVNADNREFAEKKKVERKFKEQLNQVQNGTFDKNSHLQLGMTPDILTQKAGLPRLPLTMPYSKAYLSMNKSGDLDGNYHDLGIGTLSSLPTALHSPKYIFKHDNPQRIEVVVELKDKNDRNILTTVEFGSSGLIHGIRKEANVAITAFAPRNANYIEKRKTNGKMMYEKKS